MPHLHMIHSHTHTHTGGLFSIQSQWIGLSPSPPVPNAIGASLSDNNGLHSYQVKREEKTLIQLATCHQCPSGGVQLLLQVLRVYTMSLTQHLQDVCQVF